jgi:DNA (cytosine-5)-methyltransferase 1
MKTLALCSGYGGLELGLEFAGWEPELVAYAEKDLHASKVMARHWPDVPNMGDLTEIVDPPAVDLVTAGFPCQPVSTAGRRKGTEDERWLIKDVCRVAGDAGARILILENVLGLLSANGGDAMARVCQAMAETGFGRWEWTTVRASDVGACHRRERWFCVARHAVGGGRVGRPRKAWREPIGRTVTSWPSEDAADPDDQGNEGVGCVRPAGRAVVGSNARTATADPDSKRCEQFRVGRLLDGQRPTLGDDPDRRTRARFGAYAEAVGRWERTIGRHAPNPTTNGRLSPQFVEWMMGLPAGHVTDTPGLSRPQMLRILGNGVVPQQAAAALQLLTY